jgi:hypothetical protein
MKMYRKNLTIKMANNGTTAVGKLVGFLEALTKDETDVQIIEVKKLNKVYLTVVASVFEYWKIRRAIEKRYPGVCEYHY